MIWHDAHYDLAIIGGGINGAAIARDAALRGLHTILLDQEDFGSGASSKTSKLIHGGIRYLRNWEFSLVRSSVEERALLLKNAPHLVKPLSFIFPVYSGDPTPLWMVKLGLWVYDRMHAGDETPNHSNLSPKAILNMFPHLKGSKLIGGCLYFDAVMNDSRLLLENMLSAEKAGAFALNYTPVVHLSKLEGKIDGVIVATQKDVAEKIAAKVVVNATGAWSNRFLQQDSQPEGLRVAPTKGIHLVLPLINPEYALILTAPQDKRIFFIIPWNGCSLVGTTDTFYVGDPSAVRVEEEDVAYLMEAVHHYFPNLGLSERSIIATFAGLRPLVSFKKTAPSKMARDHVIQTSPSGLITVLGGKYTTHRKVAEETVDAVVKQLDNKESVLPCRTRDLPLYGAEGPENWESSFRREATALGLHQESIFHLTNQHGTACRAILEIIRKNPADGKQICPLHPHLFAEITYAFTVEKARTLDDWYFRRTAIGYTKCRGVRCREATEKKFAELSEKKGVKI